VNNPQVFLEKLASVSARAAKKLAIMHLKPRLAPHLHAQGLEWADVVPVLEEVNSLGELQAAVACLGKRAITAKELNQKILKLEKRLKHEVAGGRCKVNGGMTAKEQTELLYSELRELYDPMVFLENVVKAHASAAKKLAILHLKPRLAPHLRAQGLEWADVVPVLEEVDSLESMKIEFNQILNTADASRFIRQKAALNGEHAEKLLLIAEAREKLLPKLGACGYSWKQGSTALQQLDKECLKKVLHSSATPWPFAPSTPTIRVVAGSVTTQQPMEEMQQNSDWCAVDVAKKALVAKLATKKCDMNPLPEAYHIDWNDDVAPIFTEMSIQELQHICAHCKGFVRHIADPQGFIGALERKTAGKGIGLWVKTMRPQLEPLFIQKQLRWSTFLHLMQDVVLEKFASERNVQMTQENNQVTQKAAVDYRQRIQQKTENYLIQAWDGPQNDLDASMRQQMDNTELAFVRQQMDNAERVLRAVSNDKRSAAEETETVRATRERLTMLARKLQALELEEDASEHCCGVEKVEKRFSTFIHRISQQPGLGYMKLVIFWSKSNTTLQQYMVRALLCLCLVANTNG
jgi:hypothetical protein